MAEQLCTDLDLELCDRSCAGKGCGYDTTLVWTSVYCDDCNAASDDSRDGLAGARPPPATSTRTLQHKPTQPSPLNPSILC